MPGDFDQSDLVSDIGGTVSFGDDFGIGVIIPSTHPAGAGTATGTAAGYIEDVMASISGDVISGEADETVLKLAALNLVDFLRRRGVPQSSAKEVAIFEKAWNDAGQSSLSTGGKYTQEVQAALASALGALAPGSGAAPQAIL